MKKKILLAVIAAILAVLLVFTFTACNTNESPATPETPSGETPTDPENPETPGEETPTDPENPDGGDTVTVTETVTVDGVVYTPTDDGTAYTASAENQQISGEIVIQSPTEGVPVVAIEEGGFWRCSSLTSVVIPDGMTMIGEGAFYGCTSLTSIDIPDSVTEIGGSAFEGCTKLASIDIPDSVTTIGGSAFAETPWYNNLSDGLVYIGKVAYKYKGEMPEGTGIVLKEGTTCILRV